MTMTESPPAAEAAESTEPAGALPGAGLYDALTTSDHKRIGRMWLGLGLLMLAAATVLGVANALEDTDDGADVFAGANGIFQMAGLYRLGLLLLVAMPLVIGLATVVVPMQVGSSNIAFPRAAAAAVWGHLVGTAILVISVLAGGGWGAVDGVTGDEADAIELTLLGTGMVVASILLASVCLATTVVSLRTPGMGLLKTPQFAWSILVTTSVWLLTLPILIANLVVIVVDLRGGPLLFGDPEGTTRIYDQLSWVLEQPAVYSLGIVVLGIIGSIVPVVAGGRHVSHAAMVSLIGLAGVFAVGGWSQPALSDQRAEVVYVAFGLLAVVPVLASLGGNAATLAKGGIPVGLPPAQLVGALGSGLLLLLATVFGALRVIDPLDLVGTAADDAVLHLTVFACVTAVVAGLWFWAPKIDGRLLPNFGGLMITGDFLIGSVLLGVAGLLAGLDASDDLNDAMAWVAFVGAIFVALGALGVVGTKLQVMRSDVEAGDDPWDGHTLEWATPTPVPAENFLVAPARVMSESPLLDATAEAGDGDEPTDGDEGGES